MYSHGTKGGAQRGPYSASATHTRDLGIPTAADNKSGSRVGLLESVVVSVACLLPSVLNLFDGEALGSCNTRKVLGAFGVSIDLEDRSEYCPQLSSSSELIT